MKAKNLLPILFVMLCTLAGHAQFTITPAPVGIPATVFFCPEGDDGLGNGLVSASFTSPSQYRFKWTTAVGGSTNSGLLEDSAGYTFDLSENYGTISLQTTDNSGTNWDTVPNSSFVLGTYESPTISFSSNQTEYCHGDPWGIAVVGEGTGLTYTWNGPSGQTSEPFTVDSDTDNGVWTVYATDDNGCISDTLSTTIAVHENPTISFSSNQTEYCDGTAWNIIPDAEAGFSYTWYQGGIETEQPVNVSDATEGSWQLFVENDSNSACNDESQEFDVVVFANPEISDSTTITDYCEGSTLNLQIILENGEESNTTYKWKWSVDTSSASTNSPALNMMIAQFYDCGPMDCVNCPSTNQSYLVTARESHGNDLSCVSEEVSIPIVVNDSVTGTFSTDQVSTIICNDISGYNLESLVELDESCDNTTISSNWLVNDISTTNQTNFDFTDFNSLDIRITQVITRGQCTSEISGLMSVLASPTTLEYSQDTVTTYCAGEQLHISAEVIGITTPGTNPDSSIIWTSSPTFFQLNESQFVSEQSLYDYDSLLWTASITYEYNIDGFGKTCQSEAPDSTKFMTLVTKAYEIQATVEPGYCRESLVDLVTNNVFTVDDSAFNEDDFQDEPFTHKITITGLDSDTTIDFDEFNNFPWPDTLNENVKLIYVLDHEFCMRSDTSQSFTIYQTPDPINITEHICEDEEADLGFLIDAVPAQGDYTLDGQLNTTPQTYIDTNNFFNPDAEQISSKTTIDITYENGVVYTNVGTCNVGIANFQVVVYPEIIIDETVTDFYFCSLVEASTELIWTGGDVEHSYKLISVFSGASGEAIMDTFNIDWSSLNQDSNNVKIVVRSELTESRSCTDTTNIFVVRNPSPIDPSLPINHPDLFSQYCADDSLTEFAMAYDVASGFVLDGIELWLSISPEEYTDTLLFTSGPLIKDTIDIVGFPNLEAGGTLAEPLYYNLVYNMDPKHNCPVGYKVAGDTTGLVNFYEGLFAPVQPNPIISVLDSLFCPDQNFYASIGDAVSNSTYQWSAEWVSDSLNFPPDSLGDGGLSAFWLIPEFPSGDSFKISLVETNGDCPGNTDLTISLNADSTQVPRAEIFQLSSNGALVYNDSTACYQWGRIINGAFVPIKGATYQTFFPPENDMTEIVCQAWYRAPGETVCGEPTGCYNIQFRKSINVIDPETPEAAGLPMKVFPNPNLGSFRVALSYLLEEQPYVVSLYDYTGRRVYQQFFVPSKPTGVLDVRAEGLARGMYQVVLTLRDRRMATQKVIIQ